MAGYQQDLDRGQDGVLPVMAQDCLHDAGLEAADLDLIAVTVGPGSFTGIRGGIALAQGIAVAVDLPVIGGDGGRSAGRFAAATGWPDAVVRHGQPPRPDLSGGRRRRAFACGDRPADARRDRSQWPAAPRPTLPAGLRRGG